MKGRRNTGILAVLVAMMVVLGGWKALIGAAVETTEPEDDISELGSEASYASIEGAPGVPRGAGRVQGRVNFAIPGMPWTQKFEMCSEIGFDWDFYYWVLDLEDDEIEELETAYRNGATLDYKPEAQPSTAASSGSFRRESNDPCRSAQFYLDMIDAPRAWAVQTGDRSVVVAVVDSGINSQHPDLRDHVVPGFDLIGESCEDPDLPEDEDCSGHGTAVAGVIGAVGDNGIGITGVAWSVSLMSVRVIRFAATSMDALVEGVRLAAEAGADVINISIAGWQHDPRYEEAIAYAIERGAVVVAAIGDALNRPPGYPAAYEGVIGVGALELAPKPVINMSSTVGPGVDLVAPGDFILSTNTYANYGRQVGSSMAAPIVSGVAALMIANGIPHDQVAEVLFRTAIWIGDPIHNIEDRETYGHGLVNAYAAVMGVDPKKTRLQLFTPEGVPVGNAVSPNEERRYALDDVPAGEELYLLAWIDVDRDGLLNQGDYVALKRIVLEEGETLVVDIDVAVLDASISLAVDAPRLDLDALTPWLPDEV